MSLKDLLKITIFLSALMTITTMLGSPVSAGKVAMTSPPYNFMEEAMVMVNCSEASLTASISLITPNQTFVHFPSGVNMMDSNFALCESVSVSFSPMGSVLWYLFDSTNTAIAIGYADAITPSIGGAFGLSFSFFSAEITDSKTNVTYTSSAIANVLSYYTTTLKPSCLKSDLAGFSNAIPNILNVLPSKSYAGITGHKTSGGYDWQYEFFVGYFKMQIPTGSGYTVNVLNLLGTTSLTPSSYAYADAYYNSMAPVAITSKTTVSFVSCNPTNISDQYITRGWYVVPLNPYIQGLSAIFFFGNDATPVTVLTFTFSGTIVVPEFSSLTLIIAMIVCTIGVTIFKRHFPKISNKNMPSLR